jgi:hypothetical protein
MNISNPIILLGERCNNKFRKIGNNYHLSIPENGIELSSFDGISIDTIFLYSDPNEDQNESFKKFLGIIPFKLTFDLSRVEILNLLGTPESSGGNKTFLGMYIPPWDRFEKDDKYIHIRYNNKNMNIQIISIYLKTALLINRMEKA